MAKTLEKLEKAEKKVLDALSSIECLNTGKETITASLKCEESLSADGTFNLPLYVHGDMLGVGQHKSRYYLPEELEQGVTAFNKMAMKLDHKRTEAGSTVGAVDKLVWDAERQIVVYEAHINDETHARNILDGVTTQVSVTSQAVNLTHPLYGIVATELEFVELSLVEGGAYKSNTLKVGKNV